MGFYGKHVPDGCRLVSYAPSFGNVEIPERYQTKVKELLTRYDRLAAREESGCEMVRHLTGREVERTIDPVFLVDNKSNLKNSSHLTTKAQMLPNSM